MQIIGALNTIINWNEVQISKHSGETGSAYQRTAELGNVRLRIVEYSSGFKADHWCCRGHVIYVLAGEIIFELKDRIRVILIKGMSWCSHDNNENAHIIFTENGACYLLLID